MNEYRNQSYRFVSRRRPLPQPQVNIPQKTNQTQYQSNFSNRKQLNKFYLSNSNPKSIKILPKIQHSLLLANQPHRYLQMQSNQVDYMGFKHNEFFELDQKRTTSYMKSQRKSRLTNNLVDKSHQNQTLMINNEPDVTIINPSFTLPVYKAQQPVHFVLNRQGKRPYNQDRYLIKQNLQKSSLSKVTNPGHIYSIFDGHGGSKCAQFLRDNIISLLLNSKHFQQSSQLAIKQSFQQAQSKFIYNCENKKGFLQTSGACAILCMIKDNKIIVASVGDCRAIMWNTKEIIEMTKDHKPTDYHQKIRIIKSGGKIYKEQLRINKSQFGSTIRNFTVTRVAPGNLNVSRTLGDIQAKVKKYGGLPGMISPQPQIKVFQIQNYDILLLASDGLFQAFTNRQVHQFYCKLMLRQINYHLTIQQKVKKFIKELMDQAQKKSTDNITIIVVMLNQSNMNQLISLQKKKST